MITTVAGNGNLGFSGDGGLATSATLNQPFGIATDSVCNIFIADTYNSRVLKVDTTGTITTVAGEGTSFPGDGGPASSAVLSFTFGIFADGNGNLFITELGQRVRKVDSRGIISTVAGNGIGGLSADGAAATSASLQFHADSGSGAGGVDPGATRSFDRSGTSLENRIKEAHARSGFSLVVERRTIPMLFAAA